MVTTAPPLRNATDAYITSKRPTLTRHNTNRLLVSSGGDGNTHRAFIFHTIPVPRFASVLDGKFRFTTVGAMTETITFTITPITGRWNASRINWNRQPSVNDTAAKTVTKTAPADRTVWEVDVRDIIQSAVNTGVWFGLRITVDRQNPVKIFSSEAASTLRPELEISWTDAPQPPEELSPAGGRAVSVPKPILSFDFVDEAGDTELNAVQIQFAPGPDEADFAAPTWDSGTYLTSIPEVDLSTIAAPTPIPPDLTSTVTYWRVRVQDGAGLWSDWSDAAGMRYVPKSTVTIDSPGAPPNNIVNDATPAIFWTITGGTQGSWQMTVRDLTDDDVPLWNSGKFTDPDTNVTIPPGVIKRDDHTYQITLMVWDTVSREKNGIHAIYTQVTRDFTFDDDATVTPITNLVAAQDAPWPWVDLTFDHGVIADEYNIWRDDEVIEANVPASDLLVSGTSFAYRDRVVAPRINHTWSVQAVVNGKSSPKVTTSPMSVRLLAPMMMELDGSNPIFFLNPKVDPQSMMFQEVHQPLDSRPVLITQRLGGYEGKVEGVFADNIFPGVTARAMRNQFKRWKRTPGKTFYFYMVDEVMKIVPYNMDYRTQAKTEGIIYTAWFDFFEVD